MIRNPIPTAHRQPVRVNLDYQRRPVQLERRQTFFISSGWLFVLGLLTLNAYVVFATVLLMAKDFPDRPEMLWLHLVMVVCIGVIARGVTKNNAFIAGMAMGLLLAPVSFFFTCAANFSI